MTNNPLFLADIMDGYSFRNIIDMFKNETNTITLVVNKQGIKIKFVNKNNCCIHDIIIFAEELNEYNYFMDNEEFPITVHINELINAIKTISRNDGLKIFLLERFGKLGIQTNKSNKITENPCSLFVNIILKEYTNLLLSDFDYSNIKHIKVLTRSFSEICTKCNTLKCKLLVISGCSNYIEFKGILSDNTIGMIKKTTVNNYVENNEQNQNKFELNVIDDNDIVNIKIPISTVKSLSKIHNITSTKTLKFYLSPKLPIKIESKIGSYGEYSIYLR